MGKQMKRRPFLTVMWWPRDERIPRGWRLCVPQAITYHSNFSVMIEKIV